MNIGCNDKKNKLGPAINKAQIKGKNLKCS